MHSIPADAKENSIPPILIGLVVGVALTLITIISLIGGVFLVVLGGALLVTLLTAALALAVVLRQLVHFVSASTRNLRSRDRQGAIPQETGMEPLRLESQGAPTFSMPVVARVTESDGQCPAVLACFLGKEFTFTNAHSFPSLCVKGQMGLSPFVEGIRNETLSDRQQWTCKGPHHSATFRIEPLVALAASHPVE